MGFAQTILRLTPLALAVALVSCSEAVRVQSVQRLPETAITDTAGQPEAAVIYRLGMNARDLARLQHWDGRLEFNIFRCPDHPLMFEPKVTIEPSSPGAAVAYVRLLVPPRFVDTDNWHCGRFAGPLGAESEVFRFQPEGVTRQTRDLAPSTVRLPPPPI